MGYKTALRPGDYFCSTSVGENSGFWATMLSSSIRAVERKKSRDGNAFYTHSGIIVNQTGKTFEARMRYGYYDIDDYLGGPIIIGRHVAMTSSRFKSGMIAPYHNDLALYRLDGRKYPKRVLVMMLLGIARLFRPTGKPVCSECVAIHMLKCGIAKLAKKVGVWEDRTPDDIADMINNWSGFVIVFEGNWPGLEAFEKFIEETKGDL